MKLSPDPKKLQLCTKISLAKNKLSVPTLTRSYTSTDSLILIMFNIFELPNFVTNSCKLGINSSALSSKLDDVGKR